jgi:diaminopimelate epimerase
LFAPSGTNVNFVEKTTDSSIFVRTYERGVENETLSCGTGVTACALAFAHYSTEQQPSLSMSHVKVETPGGALEVSWEKTMDGGFENVVLSGPAVHVFSGKINR